MALLIKGLHIEEIYIGSDKEEEQIEPLQEEPEKDEPTEEAPKSVTRKTIDKGKVGALYKAGWSVAKIADEMRCAQGTIYKIIKEMDL